MLYIFGGLPGTGKSTLAQRLARAQQAVHLRIDTIEQSLREVGCLINGPEGYVVAYQLAADNLRLGLHVVADAVNPLQITRAAWREVAMRVGVPFVEIEVICSNAAEHRARRDARHGHRWIAAPHLGRSRASCLRAMGCRTSRDRYSGPDGGAKLRGVAARAHTR